MKIRTWLGCSLMAIGLTVVAAEDDGAKTIADKSDDGAAEMIAAIEAIKPPVLDTSRVKDRDYGRAFMNEKKVYNDKRGELAEEFYREFPDHPQAFTYMLAYWQAVTTSGRGDTALAEIDQLLAANPPTAQRTNLLYARALVTVIGARIATKTGGMNAASTAIDEFINESPQDKRGASLLLRMADADHNSPPETAILKRIVENYADTPSVTMAKGQLRQTEGIGRPVELSFTDAISGKPISMADLKGKIVVLDFWSTWCSPCVDEMPYMKDLYAEYKDKGVEFIGISLDYPSDGLAKLKDFVAKNDIAWPQYYQGNSFLSAFSSEWGVNYVPCVFVFDAEGNLYSTEARGQVAKIIDTLLAKR